MYWRKDGHISVHFWYHASYSMALLACLGFWYIYPQKRASGLHLACLSQWPVCR